MLYEVITDRRLRNRNPLGRGPLAAVGQIHDRAQLVQPPDHLAAVAAEPVITSYSIHYTKLYEVQNQATTISFAGEM